MMKCCAQGWEDERPGGDFPIRNRFLGDQEGNTSGPGGMGDQIQALRASQIQSTEAEG